MAAISIAVVGDYSEAALAHRCIPQALDLAGAANAQVVTSHWIHTSALANGPSPLQGYAGIWLAPASPYASLEGALHAVRYAREKGIPFLGTCGGFQHAVLEFARHVVCLGDAGHTEINPQTQTPVIAALDCSLVEATGLIEFVPGSRLHRAYGLGRAEEGYRCRYGVNPAFRKALEHGGLCFSAFDQAGEIRAGELPQHPFFIGTLFQPERSALRVIAHPLIRAFVAAAANHASAADGDSAASGVE